MVLVENVKCKCALEMLDGTIWGLWNQQILIRVIVSTGLHTYSILCYDAHVLSRRVALFQYHFIDETS